MRGQEAVCNGQDQAASQGGALPCHGCQMHLLPAATYHMIRNIEHSPHEHFHPWQPHAPVPTMPAVKLSSDQERTRRLQQQKQQRQQQ